MPSIKPSNALASFLLLGAGLAIFNTVSKDKPAPQVVKQAAAQPKPENGTVCGECAGAGVCDYLGVDGYETCRRCKGSGFVSTTSKPKVEQCVSCEDLAEVEARVVKLEAEVVKLKARPVQHQPAPVKLIPTTPVRKPVAAKPVGHWATVCDGNSCRQVWKAGPAPKAAQKSSACSGGSCSFGRGLFGRWH